MERRCGLIALALLAGCAGAPTPPDGGGAAAAARDYCEALVRQDWEAAYGLLHTDSRAKCGRGQFVRRSQTSRPGLGLAPGAWRRRAGKGKGAGAVATSSSSATPAGRSGSTVKR